MKIAIFATNPVDSYSGGRYLSLVLAECLAYRDHEVYYVTNNKPTFCSDFEILNKHKRINLIVNDDCVLQPGGKKFDFVILIPHRNPSGYFYDNVKDFSRMTDANLVLFNFESPNWFNKYSPIKKDEIMWLQWKKCCEQECLVLSMTKEGQKYAWEYYTGNLGRTYFEYWYPAINSPVADRITVPRRKKRIVILSRLEDKHKGSEDLLEAIDQTLAGYTLVFIIGRGTIPGEYREKLENLKKKFNIRFEFKIRVSDEEKFKEIKRARLMFFPSYFEGYGYPPVEALYCGTPCVAYDLPVLRETCGDGIIYAKVGDIDDFKAKIKYALSLDYDSNDLKSNIFHIGNFENRAYELEKILGKYLDKKFQHVTVPGTGDNISPLLTGNTGIEPGNPVIDAACKYGISKLKRYGHNKLEIKGWVFGSKKIDTVSVYLDSKYLGRASVELERKDVCGKFKECSDLYCGFSILGYCPPESAFNVKFAFYSNEVLTALFEKKINLPLENAAPPAADIKKNVSPWLSIPPDDTPEMRRRIELANRREGLTANDRRIASLKDKHKGEIAFLIGNGPSVRIDDLEKLQNHVTFGCNRLYLAYDRMKFRPTYLCSSDPQMIGDFGAEMTAKHPGTVLFVARERPGVDGDFAWFEMKSTTPIEFSENVYDFVMPGGGTLIAAIQLGYHMGITRFVLYGVDHQFLYKKNENAQSVWDSAKGDGNHFISGYRSGKPWAPPLAFQVEGAFLNCHVFLQSKGGWIKNATRGGKLEILDRIDFDKICPGGGPGQSASISADIKTSNNGKIMWFCAQKQFGFIQPHRGERILFVHKKFILNPKPEGFEVGTPVCYEPYEGPKGLEARKVRILEGETTHRSPGAEPGIYVSMVKKRAQNIFKHFSQWLSRSRGKKTDKIITYYPRFKTLEELTDHYHRACWYLPHLTGILEKVNLFQKIGKNASPGDPPAHMASAGTRPPHLLVKRGIFRFYRTLRRSSLILVWKNYRPSLWKFLALFGIKAVNLDTNDLSSPEYGSYCGIIWFKLLSQEEKTAILSENYNRFSRVAYDIIDKNYSRSCVFGTGPSLEKAFEFDFTGCLNIVCNSIVQNEKLLDHIKPAFICAGDVVSHLGVSRYAGKFREDLVNVLKSRDQDLYFVTTAAFGYLFTLHHPEVKEQTILIHQSIPEPNYNLLHGFGLPILDSTLNIHMLPLASTFTDEIFLLGCDGKSTKQDNEDFWAHAREAQYYDLVNSGHLCHPTFNAHRQKKTYAGYIKSLETFINSGESNHGKTFWTLQPSNIPILKSRQVPQEWVAAGNPGKTAITHFPLGKRNLTITDGVEVNNRELPICVGFSRISIDPRGVLYINGWILSPFPVDRIEIFVNEISLGTTMLEFGTRNDIYKKYPQYNDKWIGFRFTGRMVSGNENLKLLVKFYSHRKLVKQMEKIIDDIKKNQ